MAFKLALSAGHGKNTAGKRCLKSLDANETREWVLNSRIAEKIESLLGNYSGIEILRLDDRSGATDVALSTRTTSANNFKADFYLSIHHNAGVSGGSGGGIVAFVYTSASSKSCEWQKALYDALIKHTGLRGNRATPLATANFHECRESNMPAVLLELGFMDSSTDVPIILTEQYATKCAQACVEVIVAKAGLKKKVAQVGKAYELMTNVSRYTSAADAQAQTNSQGTYTAGTYYIYNKYPDGLNGMLNISVDPSGAAAGSWINPVENVKKETVKQLYRVRKTKDDAKTQAGAYVNLDGAIECCQAAGAGYHVFDWDYNIVYSYKVPVVETVPKDVAVYDLDYPEKNKIVDYAAIDASVLDKNCVKAINGILANNPNFDAEIAKSFFKLAPKFGIDPMMAISQSVLETGWFKYGGSAVKAEQHNYCGLGVTSNGVTGNGFETIDDGVRAQLQHLYAYGCADALPDDESVVVDPRFKYVTRGIAPYWQQLAGRWACPGYDKNTYSTPEDAMKAGNTYGQKIRAIYTKLDSIVVSDDDIQKYFPLPEEAVKPDVDVIAPDDNTNEQLVEDISYIFKMLRRFIEFIVGAFKKDK